VCAARTTGTPGGENPPISDACQETQRILCYSGGPCNFIPPARPGASRKVFSPLPTRRQSSLYFIIMAIRASSGENPTQKYIICN